MDKADPKRKEPLSAEPEIKRMDNVFQALSAAANESWLGSHAIRPVSLRCGAPGAGSILDPRAPNHDHTFGGKRRWLG
jgi:hypothetical protein